MAKLNARERQNYQTIKRRMEWTVTKRKDGSKRIIQSTRFETRTTTGNPQDHDINKIVERYLKTGFAPGNSIKEPLPPGDYTNVPDLTTALNMVRHADNMFEALPSKVRNYFEQDPAQYLAHMDKIKTGDTDAIAEGVRLNIIPKPKDPPPPTTPTPTPPPTNTPPPTPPPTSTKTPPKKDPETK